MCGRSSKSAEDPAPVVGGHEQVAFIGSDQRVELSCTALGVRVRVGRQCKV